MDKKFYKNKIFLFFAGVIIFTLTWRDIGRADENDLDSIIVTANKTQENIQDVPISMTVFDEISIEDKGLENVKDIASYTSNLLLFEHPGLGVATTMRGISADPNLANSVAMFVDNVPVLGLWGFDETLLDIERVEVLKGPQGTLYGKDAEAGVINIITKVPDNELKGKLSVDIAEDNKRKIGVNVSGPIVKDKLFIGLSGRHYEKDGFIKNDFLNRDKNKIKNDFGKLYLRATPNDNLDISLVSSFFQDDSGGTDTNSIKAVKKHHVSSDLKESDKSGTSSHSLKFSYRLNNYTLENITAYRKHENDVKNDWDFTPAVIMHGKGEQDTWRLSNEFRISREGEKLKWISGIYADKDEYDGLLIIDSVFPGYSSRAKRKIGGRSIGVFGSMSYDFNRFFSLTGGLRFDRDNKTFEEKARDIDLDNSYSAFSPKIALNYSPDKNTMLYSTVSKGYRSGGYSPLAPKGLEPYEEETIINYESGVKKSWLDKSLVTNLSVFYMDIKDMQVTAALDKMSQQIYVSNAGEASSYGFELEVNYKITREFSAFAALGYTKTEFDKFEDAQGDYSGNSNILAPEYNFNAGVQYRSTSGLYGRCDINGYGKTYLDKANKYERDAYYLVNGKLGYEAKSFDVYLYADNALDESYNSVGYFGAYTIVSPPREVGLKINYRF